MNEWRKRESRGKEIEGDAEGRDQRRDGDEKEERTAWVKEMKRD